MTVLDDVRFWATIIEEQRRTLICPPSLVDAVNRKLAELGIAGLNDVISSPHVPDGQILVVDPNSMEAATRQAVQQATRHIRF